MARNILDPELPQTTPDLFAWVVLIQKQASSPNPGELRNLLHPTEVS